MGRLVVRGVAGRPYCHRGERHLVRGSFGLDLDPTSGSSRRVHSPYFASRLRCLGYRLSWLGNWLYDGHEPRTRRGRDSASGSRHCRGFWGICRGQIRPISRDRNDDYFLGILPVCWGLCRIAYSSAGRTGRHATSLHGIHEKRGSRRRRNCKIPESSRPSVAPSSQSVSNSAKCAGTEVIGTQIATTLLYFFPEYEFWCVATGRRHVRRAYVRRLSRWSIIRCTGVRGFTDRLSTLCF
jgi:hypothetical protein